MPYLRMSASWPEGTKHRHDRDEGSGVGRGHKIRHQYPSLFSLASTSQDSSLAGGPYPSSSSLGDVVLGGLFLPALLGGAFKVQDDLAAAVDGDPRDAPAGLLDGLHGRLDVALGKGQVAAAGASELL